MKIRCLIPLLAVVLGACAQTGGAHHTHGQVAAAPAPATTAAPPAQATPGASGAPAPVAKPAAPAKTDYALILPHNMPHLMRWVGKLGLPPEQAAALGKYAKEVVSPKLSPLLDEAQKLEKDIAQAALAGQTKQQLAPKLDRLQSMKREAAEIHITCINHLRNTLTPEDYARLLTLAQSE